MHNPITTTQHDSAYFAGTFLSDTERRALPADVAARHAAITAMTKFVTVTKGTADAAAELELIEHELELELNPPARIVSLVPLTVPCHLSLVYDHRDRINIARRPVIALALRSDGSLTPLTVEDVPSPDAPLTFEGRADFMLDEDIAEMDRWAKSANERAAAREKASARIAAVAARCGEANAMS